MFYPLPKPKYDFCPIYLKWYQLRHVLMVQIPGAAELKPQLQNDDEP